MAVIRLHLRGGEEQEDGVRRYAPGDSVSGTAEVVPDREGRCNGVVARLAWRTTGRGFVERGTAGDELLYSGPLAQGAPLLRDFSLTLPEAPWSYAGHYVSVVWEVTVTVDVPWSPDLTWSQQIVVRPASK